jgi:hypothetical protein
MTLSSSLSGFSTRSGSASARRSRRSASGEVKLYEIVSSSPRSRSRSSSRRRSGWLPVRRPTACRRAGSVVGSLSSPWMRATSSIRSASRWTSLSRHGGTRQALGPPATAAADSREKPSRSRMP